MWESDEGEDDGWVESEVEVEVSMLRYRALFHDLNAVNDDVASVGSVRSRDEDGAKGSIRLAILIEVEEECKESKVTESAASHPRI